MREQRTYKIEYRAEADSRMVEGYAALYDSDSNDFFLPYLNFHNSVDSFAQHLSWKSYLISTINIEMCVNISSIIMD